jgi:pimeloyl-ACP methyl ester carboxylesterase
MRVQTYLINQKRIEVLLQGDKGTPIVILTGMACSFDEWYEIVEALSITNQVISYHRPGLGNSEFVEEARNTYATVTEIFLLLQTLRIYDPVIIVGHSYGGLCAQHFVKMYPQCVAGVILVDSTSEDLEKLDNLDLPVMNNDASDEVWMEKCRQFSMMSAEQLRESIQPVLTAKQKQLPEHIQHRIIDFQFNQNMYKAMRDEIRNWKHDAAIIKGLGNFQSIPLIVIGRDCEYSIQMDVNDGWPESEVRTIEEKWASLIADQAKLSSHNELIFAEQSGHSIHLDRPDLVIASIRKIDAIVSR